MGDEEKAMAIAGHIVSAEEAEILEKTSDKVFYNLADAANIEHFMISLVASKSAIFEGTWSVDDEQEAHRKGNILDIGFENNQKDEHGAGSTKSGKVRTFFMRSNLSTKTSDTDFLSNFFGSSDKKEKNNQKVKDEKDDGEEDELEKQDNLNDTSTLDSKFTVYKEINTAIRSKVILFDGDHREKEIDLFFSINPRSHIGEHIKYQKLTDDGKVFNASAYINDPNL